MQFQDNSIFSEFDFFAVLAEMDKILYIGGYKSPVHYLLLETDTRTIYFTLRVFSKEDITAFRTVDRKSGFYHGTDINTAENLIKDKIILPDEKIVNFEILPKEVFYFLNNII